MRSLPQSPGDLREELFAIFPQYRAAYDGLLREDAPTFHSVLIAFVPFFGAQLGSFPEKQLHAFGDLVNAAVAAGGSIENAFATCLLEHLRQIRALSAFRPYLSKDARERTRP